MKLTAVCFVISVLFCLETVNGAVYIRWGRRVCPSGARVIYTGYVAGSHFTHTGGGANHLCLTSTPESGNVVPGNQVNVAYVWGTEYETVPEYENKLFSNANNHGQNLHDNDAPCVMCYRPNMEDVAMIPGTRTCPQAHTVTEYQGYIVTSFSGHQKSEFLCVDEAPETLKGGSANFGGNLFYPAQVHCGSLPCPPYVQGYELSCVMCSFGASVDGVNGVVEPCKTKH